MRKTLACASVALAAWLLAPAALSLSEARPVMKVGDQWQFAVYYAVPSATPNRTWVITAATATGFDGMENDEPLMLTSDLNVLESPRHKDSNPKALDFPLEVGKHWHYVSDWVFKPKGAMGSAAVDVTVLGYEKITVPAGEFDAFKLVAKEALSGTSPLNSVYAGATTRTYWYAPAARGIVKLVSHSPYLGPSTVELVTFDLRP